MATQLATVTVTPIEAGRYLIRCNKCQLHTLRDYRNEADQLAAAHQAAHVTHNTDAPVVTP